MQVRADQLSAHLAKGLRSLYTVWGDEPLLAQEAGDAIRAAARHGGCSERQVHTVAGAHVDWSGLLGASRAMSLFSDRQLIEIRIPSGKPGKDGAEALQRYCRSPSDDVVTLVQLPRLDRQQQSSAWFSALDAAGVTVRVDPVDRKALPQWLAQRLARSQQRVQAGDSGQRTLAFFADRVEGNLLAAHQEIEKLALLYPAGELSFEQVEAAVLNVARYDVSQLAEAVLAGQTARALRMLDALETEGMSPVPVHWQLAEDIRACHRVLTAVQAGKPLPLALREARVWGAKERLVERAVPLLTADIAGRWLIEAQICDGLVKGLKHPGWPAEPWGGLQRLVLMVTERTGGSGAPAGRRGAAADRPRLALTG